MLSETPPAQRLSATHVIFIAAVHIGTVAAFFYPSASGVALMFGLYVLTGLGITVGYHRLLAHRAFAVPRWLRRVIALAGCLAMQGGPLRWVADHREHHTDSDSHRDPHDISRGFAFAHFLWLFYVFPSDYDDRRIRRRTQDLGKDPFLTLLERYHAVPGALVGVALLLLGGLPWLLWGFCARLVLLYHATWLVNSAAHLWGPQPFPNARGTNNWVVAALTFGEGWHNNHHAWPVSARQGLKPHQVDVSWLTIQALRLLGLARQVVTVDLSVPGGRYVRS